ncbi:MAG: hypothetical protein IKS41_00240 [Alphaproteobacteria bacterium]|nr:hypothetical protein [Alphaproteobacteria bacterium]
MFKQIKRFFHWSSNESGRSMVEMLGVLAVIGVLTVGGLAGYNYAITKHRVNTILNEISLRWVVAEQQLTIGAPIDMSEFEDTILGRYAIDVYKTEGKGNSVTFQISNLSPDIVKRLFSPGSSLYDLPIKHFSIGTIKSGVAQSESDYPQLVPKAYAASDGNDCMRIRLELATNTLMNDCKKGDFGEKTYQKIVDIMNDCSVCK